MARTRAAGSAARAARLTRSDSGTVTHVLEQQLFLIAHAAHGVLIEPETGIQNVAEWATKELAWHRMKAVEVTRLPAMDELLIDSDFIVSDAVQR